MMGIIENNRFFSTVPRSLLQTPGGVGGVLLDSWAPSRLHRPDGFASADEKHAEAQCEDGMAQACAEILPERCSRTRIVGGEQHREHKEESASARGSYQDAEDERESDGKFSIGHQKGDRSGVRQHESPKHWYHEGISPTLKEFVDPKLESSVKGELRSEYFVFAEDKE